MPKRRCRILHKEFLTVASHCTGLNAAALALESLDLPYKEEWVSDSDINVRRVLAHNFSPKTILEAVQDDVPPDHLPLDFYSAGYPCQSFSKLGLQDGLQSANGQVLLYVLKRVVRKRPRTFFLENVENFHKKFKDEFKLTMEVLKSMKEGER